MAAKKDTYYFSHDFNSRTDEKIKALLSVHGFLGYGLFWAIIEDLYNNANRLKTNYESISFDLRTTPETIRSIINDFELFVIEGDVFFSLSVQKRLNEREEKSQKARESILKRWNKTGVIQTNNDSITIKDSKENGKGNKTKNSFTPPTLEEFKKYFQEHGYKTEVAERAWRGYDAAKWHDSNGKPVRNWKQKAQNVWFKEESKDGKKAGLVH